MTVEEYFEQYLGSADTSAASSLTPDAATAPAVATGVPVTPPGAPR
jgi:hypothetical protein